MVVLVLVVGGCTAPTGDDLFVDLVRIGVNVRSLGAVPTEPFDADGTLLCVAGDKVRQYTFATGEMAAAAAASIGRNDPTRIGRDSIVDWIGRPRFWHRSRSLVLYTGEDPAVEQVLIRVLGIPFAAGQGDGRMPVANVC